MAIRKVSHRALVALGVAAVGIGATLLANCTPRLADPSRDRELPEVVIPVLPAGAAVLRFFALGDSGTGDSGQHEIVRAMEFAATSGGRPDLILLLGDNFYPSGVSTSIEEQWQSKIVEPYERFGVTIYPCLGNHDYGGRVEAQIERTAIDPLWHMPATYYTFVVPIGEDATAQFWALDTEKARRKSADDVEQLAWLEATLERSTARWKVVFGHHPAFSGSVKRGDSQRMLERIVPTLSRGKVDVYLAGHDHSLQFIGPVDGVRYVVSGGGGGHDNPDAVTWRDQAQFAATGGGFVAMRLTASSAVIEFIREDGITQFAANWTKD